MVRRTRVSVGSVRQYLFAAPYGTNPVRSGNTAFCLTGWQRRCAERHHLRDFGHDLWAGECISHAVGAVISQVTSEWRSWLLPISVPSIGRRFC